MSGELKAGTAFIDLVPKINPASAAGATGALGGMFSKLTSAASAGGVGIGAALVAGVAAAGAGLFALGGKFQAAYKTIRVESGKTGEALDSLEGSFKNVLKVRPDSFGDVSLAIAKLNQGLGLTGKPLEDLATQVLRLSSITKTDLGTNLSAVTTLMNSFGVSAADQGAKVDELFRASQATGVSVSDLASSMASSGPVLKTAGFNFEQSAALLGLLGKSGISTSAVMAPLSKAIGLAAKEGKTAGDVFKDTFDKIKNAPSDTAAAGAAIEVFGARAGPRLAGLIRQGSLSYEELAKTIASGSDTIAKAGADTSTLSGKFKILKNAIEVSLEPIATKLFDAINKLAGQAMPYITGAISAFAGLVERVGEQIGAAFGLVAGWIGKITDAFKVLGGDDGPQGFGEIMDNLLGNSGKYVGFFRDLGQRILDVVETLRKGFDKVADSPILKKVVDFIEKNIKPVLISVAAVLGAAGLAGVIGVVVSVIGGLIGVFTTLVGVLASPIIVIGLLIGALVVAYQRFEGFRNIVNTVVQFLITTVVPAIVAFVTAVAAKFGELVTWVQAHWAAIQEAIGHVVAFITEVIGVAIDIIATLWRAWGDDLVNVIMTVWGFISSTVENAINFVKGIIELVLAIINGDWGKAWDAIKGILAAVWHEIGAIVSLAIDLVKSVIGAGLSLVGQIWNGAWDKIKQVISAAWGIIKDVVSKGFDAVVGFFTGMPGRIASVASGMFDGIKDAFKAVLNFIIDKWNNFKFPSITFHVPHIPGTSIGGDVTFGGWSLPNIPRLARGGDLASEGIVMVGDKGPELLDLNAGARVIPLRTQEMIDGARDGQGRDAPVVAIENATFEDETDLDMLIGRASFAATAGRFDG